MKKSSNFIHQESTFNNKNLINKKDTTFLYKNDKRIPEPYAFETNTNKYIPISIPIENNSFELKNFTEEKLKDPGNFKSINPNINHNINLNNLTNFQESNGIHNFNRIKEIESDFNKNYVNINNKYNTNNYKTENIPINNYININNNIDSHKKFTNKNDFNNLIYNSNKDINKDMDESNDLINKYKRKYLLADEFKVSNNISNKKVDYSQEKNLTINDCLKTNESIESNLSKKRFEINTSFKHDEIPKNNYLGVNTTRVHKNLEKDLKEYDHMTRVMKDKIFDYSNKLNQMTKNNQIENKNFNNENNFSSEKCKNSLDSNKINNQLRNFENISNLGISNERLNSKENKNSNSKYIMENNDKNYINNLNFNYNKLKINSLENREKELDNSNSINRNEINNYKTEDLEKNIYNLKNRIDLNLKNRDKFMDKIKEGNKNVFETKSDIKEKLNRIQNDNIYQLSPFETKGKINFIKIDNDLNNKTTTHKMKIITDSSEDSKNTNKILKNYREKYDENSKKEKPEDIFKNNIIKEYQNYNLDKNNDFLNTSDDFNNKFKNNQIYLVDYEKNERKKVTEMIKDCKKEIETYKNKIQNNYPIQEKNDSIPKLNNYQNEIINEIKNCKNRYNEGEQKPFVKKNNFIQKKFISFDNKNTDLKSADNRNTSNNPEYVNKKNNIHSKFNNNETIFNNKNSYRKHSNDFKIKKEKLPFNANHLISNSKNSTPLRTKENKIDISKTINKTKGKISKQPISKDIINKDIPFKKNLNITLINKNKNNKMNNLVNNTSIDNLMNNENSSLDENSYSLNKKNKEILLEENKILKEKVKQLEKKLAYFSENKNFLNKEKTYDDLGKDNLILELEIWKNRSEKIAKNYSDTLDHLKNQLKSEKNQYLDQIKNMRIDFQNEIEVLKKKFQDNILKNDKIIKKLKMQNETNTKKLSKVKDIITIDQISKDTKK